MECLEFINIGPTKLRKLDTIMTRLEEFFECANEKLGEIATNTGKCLIEPCTKPGLGERVRRQVGCAGDSLGEFCRVWSLK